MGIAKFAFESENAEPPAAGDQTVPSPTLIAAAMSGDQEATENLLDVLWPMVVKYCTTRFGERDISAGEVEDCAQEVLIAVVAALPNYRYPPENFVAFVYGIAGHKVTDSFRALARDRSDSVPDFTNVDGFIPRQQGEEIDGIDERVMIERFLTKIPSLYREVIRMRVIDGYSAEETAAALNMPSAGAVRTTQHRALAMLRKAMSNSERPWRRPAP